MTSDRQDAVALLEQFDELRNAGPRERIADGLRDLYPGAGRLRAIRPDRLGERHVATVIAERRDVPRLLLEYGLAALASGIDAERMSDGARLATRALTVLARAATYDDARRSIEDALSAPDVNGQPLLQRPSPACRRGRTSRASGLSPRAWRRRWRLVRVPEAAAAAARILIGVRSPMLIDLSDVLAVQRLDHARSEAVADPERMEDRSDR